MLNGEYEGLSLWKSTFKKDDKEINTIGWTIVIDGNIPNGEYFVNIYKTEEKKTEKSPDYTLYLKPKVAKAPAPAANEDDF
jgi:hypothetical protein